MLGFPIVVDGVFGACSRQIAEVVARENKVKLSDDFSFIDLEQAIVLKVGSKGPQVKKLQNFLKIKGFNLKSDGIYGENTKAAVISFQRANQLHTDGIVGINTVKKMIAKV